MKRLLLVLLFCLVLIVPTLLTTTAQDNPEWSCDGGENDVLNAALAAETAGEIERGLELAFIAEDLCQADFMRWREATQLRQRLEALAAEPPENTIDDIIALNGQGTQAFSQGRYDEAVAAFEEAIAIAQELNISSAEGTLLANLGAVYDAQGLYDEALEVYQEALRLNRAIGDRESEGVTLNNIGLAYFNQSRYREALDVYQKALEINQDIGAIEDEATTLTNLGALYEAQGEYNLALEVLQQALAIFLAEGNQEREAVLLSNIGVVYVAQGRYNAAEGIFEQALEMARDNRNRAREGTILNNLGEIYGRQARYDLALETLQEAVAISQEVGNRAEEAAALSNLASVYRSRAQYDIALETYQQALEIFREIGNPAREATVLNNIGSIYTDQALYSQAITTFEASQEIRQTLGSSGPRVLNNLANVYRLQGRRERAQELFQQSLAIFREQGNRNEEATVLNALSAVYLGFGEYDLSLQSLQLALAIHEEIGSEQGQADVLNSFGNYYNALGQNQRALESLLQALDIVRATGARAQEAVVLANIGVIFTAQNQPERGIEFLEQALTIERDSGLTAGESNTLLSLGNAYFGLDEYNTALDYFEAALVLSQELGTRDEATLLNNIGVVYVREERYREGIELLSDALAIAQETDGGGLEVGILATLGTAYLAQGETELALENYLQAIEIFEARLQTTGLDESINTLIDRNAMLYTNVTDLLINFGDLERALEFAERGRGVLARDELRNGTIDFRENLNDKSLLQEEQTLRLDVVAAQTYVDTLNQDPLASGVEIQRAQAELETAQRAYEDHLQVMQLEGGFISRELSLEVASLEEIQAVLPPDTTLLLYGISNNSTYVLTVTADDIQGFNLSATDGAIDEAIRSFATDRRSNTAPLQDFYTLLFEPIADEITTEKLLISTTSLINYVPFAAMQNPETERYLIEDYTISMVPSATTLVLLTERAAQQSERPASPGLILSQRNAPGLAPLQNADTEANSVAATLNTVSITDATESDLRTNSLDTEIIHISAHAELNPFAPLYSTIYLDEDDSHDGRFEVREIYELDLAAGTELVVLSGCETGTGGDGEDFGLLNRAFFGAGAPRVVASLWQVDDEATAVLLTAFYEKLETTDNYAEALQMAMLSTMEAYPNPFFWAPFVLTGVPQ